MTNSSANCPPEARSLTCRGIRGATTAEENSREAILLSTGELLWYLIERNGIAPDDLASGYFTTTRDLDAEFPALAARKLGWHDVALLCGHEMQVPGSLDRCIRVLLHWNTTKTAAEIQHVFIRGARNLRPDQQSLLELPEVPVPRFDLA